MFQSHWISPQTFVSNGVYPAKIGQAGRVGFSDLLPLGGNLSLVLLIEIVPRQSNLKTDAVCVQPSLFFKSRRCECRPYLHQTKSHLLTGKLFRSNFYAGSEY